MQSRAKGLERFSLAGRTAVVAGGSSGIGRAIAIGLAEVGAHVIVAGRNRSRGEDTCAAIAQVGVRTCFIPCDVADPLSVEQLAQQGWAWTGRVDVLVNSAGLNLARTPAVETADEIWDRTLQTNFMGAVRLARALGGRMLAAGGGRVIHVTSLSHVITSRNIGPYAASKAAMMQLTRTLALEWAAGGVTVNALCPGRVVTPLISDVMQDPAQVRLMYERIPLQRIAEPDDMTGPAIFLASDASSYLTGATLIVDGGWSISS